MEVETDGTGKAEVIVDWSLNQFMNALIGFVFPPVQTKPDQPDQCHHLGRWENWMKRRGKKEKNEDKI